MNKIYFSIPDFWDHFDLNLFLIRLYNDKRYYFNDDIVIDNIYGSFPCIWNGGRVLSGSTFGRNIRDTIKAFNDLGVSIRFTFTNSLLRNNHLQDTLGNQILSICEDSFGNNLHNSVTVSTKLMMDYIEQNYPNYYCLWSTTLGVKDIKAINDLSSSHVLVLNYFLNNDWDKIKKLSNPSNIEILCSEICEVDCKYRDLHYQSISQSNLYQVVDDFICPHKVELEDRFYSRVLKSPSYVSIDRIRNNYLPLGINKFKLNGRNEPTVNIIERYVNYLVKPDYRDEVRNRLLIHEFPN